MLVVAFLQWWYGPGWGDMARRLQRRLRQTYLDFSVPILLRTLFAPWRRITTVSQGSLGMRGRAMIDNLISRAVGLNVRLIALLTAGIVMLVTSVFGGAILILWPIIPPLGFILIAGGLIL